MWYVSDDGYTLWAIPGEPPTALPKGWTWHEFTDPGAGIIAPWRVARPTRITRGMYHWPPLWVCNTREEAERRLLRRDCEAVVPFPLGGWVTVWTGRPLYGGDPTPDALARVEKLRKSWEGDNERA